MFTKVCEYGIKASTYISLQPLEGNRMRLKETAREIDSPVAFPIKILHQLAKNKIPVLVKGPLGGFKIQKEKIDSTKLSDIVNALDGDSIYEGYSLEILLCNATQPCSMQEEFVSIRDELRETLQNASLYRLPAGLKVGLT